MSDFNTIEDKFKKYNVDIVKKELKNDRFIVYV